MSSRNRPFGRMAQEPQTPRNAPSTPHALKALQQRSGAKQRSTRARRTLSDLPRPDSARGILRQLSRIRAGQTQKRVPTPVGNKENARIAEQDLTDEDEIEATRPDFTLPIEELDEEESELLHAPTPSILRDEEHYPSLTFKAIDFTQSSRLTGANIDRISHGVSQNEWDDSEEEFTAEYGRRARSEDPFDRRAIRNSFGSLRMSNFGSEPKRRVTLESMGQDHLRDDEHDGDDVTLLIDQDGETEDFRRLRQGLIEPVSHNDSQFMLPMQEDDSNESTYELDMHNQLPNERHIVDDGNSDEGDGDGYNYADADADEMHKVKIPHPTAPQSNSLAQNSPGRIHTQKQAEVSASRPRRKKILKVTRRGATIPSLPASLIRHIATESRTRIGKPKPKLGRDHMKALEQATEWFFEQVGEDLAAYSNHAKRKKVDPSDVLTLIRRQRILKKGGDLETLAKEVLSAEAFEGLHLPESL